MQEVTVETVADPDLDAPVFVEGLPGVGHVGKLVVDHLIEELESDPVRRIHSEHFPPQVTVDGEGVTSLAGVEIHALSAGGRDLLALAGDHQAVDNVGHYRLAETFLDAAEAFGTSEIVALGGMPTGEVVEEYEVVGAVTDPERRERFADAGVTFEGGEPQGGIVGTSGLLLGLGERRGIPGACLMGKTSGYIVDPLSARAVLEVLQPVLGFEVGLSRLEERAEELEELVEEMGEGPGGQAPSQGEGGATATNDEDLRYIG